MVRKLQYKYYPLATQVAIQKGDLSQNGYGLKNSQEQDIYLKTSYKNSYINSYLFF